MAITCTNCAKIIFSKSARKCPDCGYPISLTPTLVNYIPDGRRANGMIQALNDLVPTMSPQEFAGFLSSSVAAAAYMMLEMNSPATVKEVFGFIIDDAQKQRDNLTKKKAN